jgi:hypothetical protein
MERYWQLTPPRLHPLVRELEPLDLQHLPGLSARAWYDFLNDKYFPWKYTALNRLATTRKSLRRYIEEGRLDALLRIRDRLLAIRKEDIEEGLEIAESIHGLGTAGASGLLALMYPEHFGTVDEFLVLALRKVPDCLRSNDWKV